MKKYFSQHGEDFLLWQVFGDNSSGFFIDVGAFDGIHLSNSYSFELAGWTGICLEAHPAFYELCRKNRPRSQCIHAACLDDSSMTEATFFAETLGLLSSVEPDRDQDVRRRYSNRGLEFQGFEEFTVPSTTLNRLLGDTGFNLEIDFVSIDVEGSELKVLRGFDLAKYSPRVLIIEANDDNCERDLDQYLSDFGYLKARKLALNVFYCMSREDKRILQRTRIRCEIEPTAHPLGEKYTAMRKLKYEDHGTGVPAKVKRLLKSFARIRK